MSNGYGQFWDGDRLIYAHRYVYEKEVGPIPDGFHLDHLCRNTSCVNPAHLDPVTPQINSLRGRGIAFDNAVKTHCAQGHPFSESNTIRTTDPRGGKHRRCKTCAAEWDRTYYTRRKHQSPPPASGS